MTNAQELYSEYVRRLELAGVFSPQSNVRKIFAHVCGVDSEFEFSFQRVLTDAQKDRIEACILRREQREPLARIFGQIDFFNVTINVDKNVFRPCFETEALVEHVLEHATTHRPPARILDLGTGTGCLLLSLLKAFEHATGTGVDIDEAAILSAQNNARQNGLEDRAAFLLNNWGDGLNEKFDLVIGNPPAVPSQNVRLMLPEMKDHDPLISLDGGPDGLAFYHYASRNLKGLLAPDGIGVFRCYSINVESSLFKKKGFNTEIKTDYLRQPCCLFVSHKEGTSWMERVLSLFH